MPFDKTDSDTECPSVCYERKQTQELKIRKKIKKNLFYNAKYGKKMYPAADIPLQLTLQICLTS